MCNSLKEMLSSDNIPLLQEESTTDKNGVKRAMMEELLQLASQFKGAVWCLFAGFGRIKATWYQPAFFPLAVPPLSTVDFASVVANGTCKGIYQKDISFALLLLDVGAHRNSFISSSAWHPVAILTLSSKKIGNVPVKCTQCNLAVINSVSPPATSSCRAPQWHCSDTAVLEGHES